MYAEEIGVGIRKIEAGIQNYINTIVKSSTEFV